MWICLYITIILTSVVFIPIGADVSNLSKTYGFFWPKEFMFILGSWCCVISTMFKNLDKKRIFRNPWIGVLLGIVLLNFAWQFFYPFIEGILVDKQYWNIKAVRPFIGIMTSFILAIILIENTDVFKHWVTLSKVLCWLAFGFSCYAILQYFGIEQIFGNYSINYVNDQPEDRIRILTFMGNRVLSASFISIISPLCLMFKETRYKCMYVVIFLALILCESTISLITFFTGLFVYLILTKRFIKVLFLCLASLGVLFFMSQKYPDFLSLSGRMTVWKESVLFVINSKMAFTGMGIGKFSGEFFSGKEMALFAHNDYVQVFYEFGFIMFIACVGYLINLCMRLFRMYVNDNNILLIGYISMFSGILIMMIGLSPLMFPPTALLILICITCLETQLTRRIV